jgi:hypothetical protein
MAELAESARFELACPLRSQRRSKTCRLSTPATLHSRTWSGRQDSNLRPPAPEAGALPDCATPRTTTANLAESEGFEPPCPCEPTAFEAGALVQLGQLSGTAGQAGSLSVFYALTYPRYVALMRSPHKNDAFGIL